MSLKFTEIMRNFSSVLGTVVIVPSYNKRHEFVTPPMMMRRCLLPYVRPCGKCVAHKVSFSARGVERRQAKAKCYQRAETSAKRKSTSLCLLARPAFDRIAGLSNRHLNSNRGLCLR